MNTYFLVFSVFGFDCMCSSLFVRVRLPFTLFFKANGTHDGTYVLVGIHDRKANSSLIAELN